MKLEELLEHTAADYLDDRTELLDGDADELWKDTTIVRYYNEAQFTLARRAWVLKDVGTAPAALITLRTGVSLYPLHKSILRIHDATPTTQQAPLGRADDIELRDPTVVNGDAFSRGEAAALAGNTLTNAGPPLAFASDAGWKTLRVYPAPAAAQNGQQISLKITRLPICLLDVNKLKAEPEIPEEYHLWLSDYAAGRCLSHPNVGGQGRAEGRRLLDEFAVHVREARQDRQRAEDNGNRWCFASTTAVLR